MPRLAMSGAASAGAFGFNKLAQAVNDAYFSRNVLLLPGNGTNGAQNNTFLDSSSNNFSITRNGNTTQGTFSPFSQSGWSAYFDGAADYVDAPSAASISGTGDFTVEALIFPQQFNAGVSIIQANTTANGLTGILMNNTGTIGMGKANVSQDATSTNAVTLNTWNHVAVSRQSGTVRIFINGVMGYSGTQTTSFAAGTVRFGTEADGTSNPFKGYISSYRSVAGTAVYTANFTPPTAPLTAIAGTTLIAFQANRFADSSVNNYTLTKSGDVSIQPFSPFTPTAAYSAATNGGSGYFDGSGDDLRAASNAAFGFGTGDATVEAFIYPTSVSGTQIFFDTRNGAAGIGFYLSGATLSVAKDNSTVLMSGGTVPVNAWSHVVWSRSGSTNRLFLNGALTSTVTDSTNYPTSAVSIGSYFGASYFSGYVSQVRVLKGTAQYTTGFTPPTAPLIAITNTQLLLNFTNGGIIDATGKNVLETVGTVALSTTQKRSGSASISFPGTSGNYLKAVVSPLLRPRTADFTFECSVYFNNVTPAFGYGLIGDESLTGSLDVRWNKSDNTLRIGRVGVAFDNTFSWTPSANTWYDIEISRVSGTLYAFVNGVLIGSGANTIDYQGTASVILGATSSTDNPLNGYLDDARYTVSKGRNSTAYLVSLPFPLQ